MKRLVAGLVGTILLFAPIRFLYVTMVPLPAYRTGTFDDYGYALLGGLMIYGGATVGLLVAGWQSAGSRHAIRYGRVFWLGVAGAVVTNCVVMGGWGVYRWVTLGSVMNSWALAPVVALFAAGLSAVVAAGAALNWYALRGPANVVKA